jgi:cytochrome P450
LQKTQFIKDLESVMMLSGMSVELPWLLPLFTILQPNRRLAAAARAAIAETRKDGKAGTEQQTTIFAKMVAAGDDETLTLAQIEREASNLIVAGSDTTAVTLTYLIYAVLSSDEGVREQLIEELSHLGQEFTAQEAAALPFLSSVIQETLRLYGAAPGRLQPVLSRGPKS